MCGTAARVQRKVERRLSRSVKSQSAAVISQMRALRLPPTLLTRMSRRPHPATPGSGRRAAGSSSVTSPTVDTVSPPTCAIPATARSRPAASMSPSTTRAPSPASRSAIARPSPLAAPVTTATLPSTRPIAAILLQPAISGREERLRDQRGDDVVRHIHHVADAEIRGDARDDVGLLASPAALLEQVDQVEQGVAARQREVLPFVDTVLADGHAGGGEEAPRGRPLGRREVVAVPEPRAARQGRARILDHPELHHRGRPHLHCGHADLAVT